VRIAPKTNSSFVVVCSAWTDRRYGTGTYLPGTCAAGTIDSQRLVFNSSVGKVMRVCEVLLSRAAS
jgi:hypothetical protein